MSFFLSVFKCLFLSVSYIGLRSVIVAFPGLTPIFSFFVIYYFSLLICSYIYCVTLVLVSFYLGTTDASSTNLISGFLRLATAGQTVQISRMICFLYDGITILWFTNGDLGIAGRHYCRVYCLNCNSSQSIIHLWFLMQLI